MTASRLATSLLACVFLAGCSTLAPVTELTFQQAAQLPAFTEVPLFQAGFRTQALVTVSGKSAQTGIDVSRHGDATSAAYAGVLLKSYAISPPPGPASTAAPLSGSVFQFKESGDAGQGWATTTVAGMPFLQTQAVGKASASGTASWTASITTTPGHQNVYVQFQLPVAQLTGATEQNGPSPWQSRMRAEFAVNGHPFWLAEVTRVSRLDAGGQGGGADNCGDGFEGSNKVMGFGKTLSFTDANETSTGQIVTLSLGAFPAGQSVSMGFIVRADAAVERQCCPKNKAGDPEFFCTRATANVAWDSSALPVRIWIGPPIV